METFRAFRRGLREVQHHRGGEVPEQRGSLESAAHQQGGLPLAFAPCQQVAEQVQHRLRGARVAIVGHDVQHMTTHSALVAQVERQLTARPQRGAGLGVRREVQEQHRHRGLQDGPILTGARPSGKEVDLGDFAQSHFLYSAQAPGLPSWVRRLASALGEEVPAAAVAARRSAAVTFPIPFGTTTVHARYDLLVEPLGAGEEIEPVAARVAPLWRVHEEDGESWSRKEYLGDQAKRVGSYHVTWVEGVVRPLRREALWRVLRAGDRLVWCALDMQGWCRTPNWLSEALSGLLRDVNAGLHERDLGVLPAVPDRRVEWRRIHGVGSTRSLRLDRFNHDLGADADDVIHLRDLPELLWLVADFPGGTVYEWHQGFLNLVHGLFETLDLTGHWLYRGLPTRLKSREQIVKAATSTPVQRDAATLRSLWDWRDRLMASAQPWSGVMMCQHPVLRGRDGRTWEGWATGDGEVSDLLAGLGDDIARSVLDNIDVARRLGEPMVGLWGLGALVDEPVRVGEASVPS